MLLECLRPDDSFYTRDFGGFFLGEFFAFPNRDEFACFFDKEYLAVFFLVGIGIENQHRLFLIDAGKIVEVRVLDEGHHAVRVGRQDVVGEHNCDRVRLQQFA